MTNALKNFAFSRDNHLVDGGGGGIPHLAHAESSVGPGATGSESDSHRPGISLAIAGTARYSIDRKPAGPLPQGTLTSAGVSLRGG